MVDFIVEDGVPLPNDNRRGKSCFGYTNALRSLPIGGSVFRPNIKYNTVGGIIVRVRREDRSKTFVSRTVDGGVRVWRVA